MILKSKNNERTKSKSAVNPKSSLNFLNSFSRPPFFPMCRLVPVRCGGDFSSLWTKSRNLGTGHHVDSLARQLSCKCSLSKGLSDIYHCTRTCLAWPCWANSCGRHFLRPEMASEHNVAIQHCRLQKHECSE